MREGDEVAGRMAEGVGIARFCLVMRLDVGCAGRMGRPDVRSVASGCGKSWAPTSVRRGWAARKRLCWVQVGWCVVGDRRVLRRWKPPTFLPFVRSYIQRYLPTSHTSVISGAISSTILNIGKQAVCFNRKDNLSDGFLLARANTIAGCGNAIGDGQAQVC